MPKVISPWIPVGVSLIPVFLVFLGGFVTLRSDVDVIQSAQAAEEQQYNALSGKIGKIQGEVQNQGLRQAVIGQKVKDIERQIQRLERSTSESSKAQAEILRKILSEVKK